MKCERCNEEVETGIMNIIEHDRVCKDNVFIDKIKFNSFKRESLPIYLSEKTFEILEEILKKPDKKIKI